MSLTQKSLYFVVFRPKTTVWPSLGRISVEILMATPRSRQIFRWRRRRRLHFVFFFMLFYSIELLHIHITCLHVYYCLHIPSFLAQDARLCHGRGQDSRKLWRYPNSSSRLGFHGFGVAHAKGGLEVALPPNASKVFCRRQGHQGRVTACGRRRRPDCRSTRIADRCSLGNCRS